MTFANIAATVIGANDNYTQNGRILTVVIVVSHLYCNNYIAAVSCDDDNRLQMFIFPYPREWFW